MSYREEKEKNERFIDRLLNFNREEKIAYLHVELFLTAVGALFDMKGGGVGPHMSITEVNRFFSIFASAMGWNDALSTTSADGMNLAVGLHYRDEDKSSEDAFWVITPLHHYWCGGFRVRESPEKQRLLEAARVVCKAWLPDWEWERLNLSALK